MENSLTGFEFACGIPGTIGGAVFMNAGAYDGEISHVIESAEVIDENCNIINLTNEALDFGYRSSLVMKKGYIVLSAVAFPLLITNPECFSETAAPPIEYPFSPASWISLPAK